MTIDRKPLLERYDIEGSDYWTAAHPNGAFVAYAAYEADRAKLLDRIAELEGMVPKWVDFHAMDYVTLCSNGWRSLRVVSGLALMVPPIPLPKGGE